MKKSLSDIIKVEAAKFETTPSAVKTALETQGVRVKVLTRIDKVRNKTEMKTEVKGYQLLTIGGYDQVVPFWVCMIRV